MLREKDKNKYSNNKINKIIKHRDEDTNGTHLGNLEKSTISIIFFYFRKLFHTN
jgi:hypothetical protein